MTTITTEPPGQSDREEWEQRLRAWLKEAAEDVTFSHMSGIEVEDVLLEGSYPDTTIAFIYRDPRQPEHVFGFRWGKFWEDVEANAVARGVAWYNEDFTDFNVALGNFIEALERQPAPTARGGITWYGPGMES